MTSLVAQFVQDLRGLIVDGVDEGHIYLPAGPTDPHVFAGLAGWRSAQRPRVWSAS